MHLFNDDGLIFKKPYVVKTLADFIEYLSFEALVSFYVIGFHVKVCFGLEREAPLLQTTQSPCAHGSFATSREVEYAGPEFMQMSDVLIS